MCPALCCLIGASLNSCMELDDSVYTTIVMLILHGVLLLSVQ